MILSGKLISSNHLETNELFTSDCSNEITTVEIRVEIKNSLWRWELDLFWWLYSKTVYCNIYSTIPYKNFVLSEENKYIRSDVDFTSLDFKSYIIKYSPFQGPLRTQNYHFHKIKKEYHKNFFHHIKPDVYFTTHICNSIPFTYVIISS